MAAGIVLRSAINNAPVAAAGGLQRHTIFAAAQSNNSIRNAGGWESAIAQDSRQPQSRLSSIRLKLHSCNLDSVGAE